MSQTQTVELTEQQRDLLLQGLRYVQSSVKYEMREPSPEVDADRAEQLREIDSLAERLKGGRPSTTTADV